MIAYALLGIAARACRLLELLFRWIKQHLKTRKFLGNNDNAVRLQLFAALIAYALLGIAARACRIAMPILRFTDLVTRCLFERRNVAAIDKPPPVNPSQRKPNSSPKPDVLYLCMTFPGQPCDGRERDFGDQNRGDDDVTGLAWAGPVGVGDRRGERDRPQDGAQIH
ncbi:hypothetical protein X729_31040 [Mesorhizobium sp. L103C131B0]|nr:hypothetical protein X729_31040 [Mesorhizobium sp. L103C131B0]